MRNSRRRQNERKTTEADAPPLKLIKCVNFAPITAREETQEEADVRHASEAYRIRTFCLSTDSFTQNIVKIYTCGTMNIVCRLFDSFN